jgi:ribonuclease E
VLDPPEVVHVEMTPDEQDIYAWMGISPMILVNKELKNPKSAIIAVTLPGEAPPEVVVPSELQAAEPTSEGADTAPDIAPDDAPVEPEFAVMPSLDLDQPPEEPLASDEKEPPRRRRRRSSAALAE